MPLTNTDWTPTPHGRVRALNGAIGVLDHRGREVYDRAAHRSAVAAWLRVHRTRCERCAHYGLDRQAVRVVVTSRYERVAMCDEHARRMERDGGTAALALAPDQPTDPISGRPMQCVGPIRQTGAGCVDATGRKVTLSEFGDWVPVDPRHCDGCDEHDVPTRPFVVVATDGSRTPARYCADCEVVARIDGAEGGVVEAA